MDRLSLTQALLPHAQRVEGASTRAEIRRRPQRAKLPSSSSSTPTAEGKKKTPWRYIPIEEMEPAWKRRARRVAAERIIGIERILRLAIKAGWLIAKTTPDPDLSKPVDLDWYREETGVHSTERAAWLLGVSPHVFEAMRQGRETSARAVSIVDGLIRKNPRTLEEAYDNALALRRGSKKK